MLTRSLYHIDLKNTSGQYDKYSVNVEYYEAGEEVELYLNDKHIGSSSSPATFPVSGGYIDVQTTLYGLKRMHYVGDNHREIVLDPNAGTAEELRNKFALKYPLASRLISWLAIFILLLSIIVGIPQFIELITHLDIISENIGTFNSPINLPGWLNTTFTVLAALAALERALTLKSNWLIDIDTTTYGDG